MSIIAIIIYQGLVKIVFFLILTGTDADWADVPAGSKEFTISSGLTAEGTATVEVRSKLSCDNSDSDTLYSDAATLSVNTSNSFSPPIILILDINIKNRDW